MESVIKTLLLIGAVVGLLLVPAGCGGDESELCQSLDDLQESVEGLRDIQLNESAVDELRQAADEISDDINAVQEAAEEELGPELTNLETAARTLIGDAEAALAQGDLSSETLATLATAVGNAVNAYEALLEAAPDC